MIADAALSSCTSSMKPMRVCFVIDRLSRAGTENQLLLTLKQLDRSLIEPYLCLLDGGDPASQELLPPDCQVLQLGVRRLVSAKAVSQAWRFWQFLRRERIDIVQTYFTDSTRFAAPIAKIAGVKSIFGSRRNIGHWMTPRDARIARFYNRFFIDKIIANSEAARQSAIEQEGIDPERVVVVPNSIDLERFKHIPPWQPKPAGVPRKVGMVGNLRPVKGPDLFIRAAHLVLQEHPDTQFEIAGDGDQAPYQQLIDELGLTHNVRLLGSVTDVPAFLATLDVAVLPSRAEGLSNALMEYMAAGRPIVATDVGGNGELLDALSEKCCVSCSDHKQIFERINLFLGDRKEAASLAHLAKELAFKTTSLSAGNEAYASVF
jgi:glycosyltransferase involved in cell wall biosynthesis